MKIGLLGGAFNPVHLGHLALAQESLRRCALDKVIFIPSGVSPHKRIEGGATDADRLNMVRLAIARDDRFLISTFELDSPGPSYSINTINHFTKEYPGAELYFISGEDLSGGLSKWKEIDRILAAVKFIVAPRKGFEIEEPFINKVIRIDMPLIDISSSVIREKIRKKESIDPFVPGEVASYLRSRALYSGQD